MLLLRKLRQLHQKHLKWNCRGSSRRHKSSNRKQPQTLLPMPIQRTPQTTRRLWCFLIPRQRKHRQKHPLLPMLLHPHQMPLQHLKFLPNLLSHKLLQNRPNQHNQKHHPSQKPSRRRRLLNPLQRNKHLLQWNPIWVNLWKAMKPSKALMRRTRL